MARDLVDQIDSSVPASPTSVTLLAENGFREGVRIKNNSTKRLYLRWGLAAASVFAYDYYLEPGQTYTEPEPVPEDPLQGCWFAADGAGTAIINEFKSIKGRTAAGAFNGGTITAPFVSTVAGITDEAININMRNGTTAYPMLVYGSVADTLNTERRWFMLHPEGGLCLSSAREPNWATLHIYKWGPAMTKDLIRITDELAAAGGPHDLFRVDKDGGLVISPQAAIDPVIVKNNAAVELLRVKADGTASGRGASFLKTPQRIVFEAIGYKSFTGQPTNTGDVFASGEMRLTAIGLRGGEAYTSAKFVSLAAAVGTTLARVAIYDSAFNLVAQSAEFSAALNGAVNLVSVNLSAPYTPASDGLYYIGLFTVGGTAPSVCQIAGGNGNDANFGGKYLSWRQTALAALPNPAVRAAGSQPYFWALA